MERSEKKDIMVNDSWPEKVFVNFNYGFEVKGIYKARQLTSYSSGHAK